jgi:hypothetical protein
MHAKAGPGHAAKIDHIGRKDGAGMGWIDALFIHGMTGLLPQGKDAAGGQLFVEAAGDVRVVAGQGNLERVDGVTQPTAIQVIAHALDPLEAKDLLLGIGGALYQRHKGSFSWL